EHRAAALVVGGRAGALAGPAGALLAVRLRAAAAALAAGLRVVRPKVASGELGGHDLVEDGGVDRRGEQGVGQLDAADGLARPAVEGRVLHLEGLLTRAR